MHGVRPGPGRPELQLQLHLGLIQLFSMVTDLVHLQHSQLGLQPKQLPAIPFTMPPSPAAARRGGMSRQTSRSSFRSNTGLCPGLSASTPSCPSSCNPSHRSCSKTKLTVQVPGRADLSQLDGSPVWRLDIFMLDILVRAT